MTNFKDIFISYGRPDSKTFAILLKNRLEAEGFSVWLDLSDIPLGIDYKNYINASIDRAHNFLFIISPHAANSVHCTLEIEQALTFNKRIIPILHVSQTDRETWQQRHPNGSEDDWVSYQAEGRHSSFENLHPAIKKLNWASFQEETTDFEVALQGLVQLLREHESYVHQHTALLDYALAWLEHQKQTRFLLNGKACKAAEDWLGTKNDLVSCMPSQLHCEFITESIKNIHNWMTNVFLSYAEEDKAVVEKIRQSLISKGVTVWNSHTDIQTGEDFVQALHRGIEQADNLVYFISPDSIQSPYCQDELSYALSLNKRIIPLLVRPTESEKIPSEIREFQHIELTDFLNEESYTLAESQLLQALKQQAIYHAEHKNLLVKALKWQRQERNPSILLRSYQLRHYEAWLKIARQRKRYKPVALQETFVAESVKQPPDLTVDVFIAFDPIDIDFARKLNDTLQVQGQSTWFEPESIDPETRDEEEIRRGILIAENVLLLVSSHALDSSTTQDDIEYALSLNKRILTVFYGQSLDAVLTPELKEFPQVDFRYHDGDFLTNFGQLYRLLESNPQHVRTHTQLLQKAQEWQQEDRDDSFLLRGRTLATAEAWLSQAAQQKPQPTALQREYIQASRELPLRRVRPIWVGAAGVGATVLVALARLAGIFQGVEFAIYDHLQRQRPDEQQDDRFLIVQVDNSSSSALQQKMIAGDYQPGIGTIPDQALAETLSALAAHQPRLIGLDFYRDFPASAELAPHLRDMDNLVGICKATAGEAERLAAEGLLLGSQLEGVRPIYELSPQDYAQRIGYSDMLDDGNKMVRRLYLYKLPDPDYCDVYQSFSMLLAQRYLAGERVTFEPPIYEQEGRLKRRRAGLIIDQVAIPRLRVGRGPYIDSALLGGYQTLINWRTVDGDPTRFAHSVTLAEVLEGRVEPALIRDRIVLIGFTDLVDRNADFFNTALGEVPGVYLHGQMTSQLISAVLDNRPMPWWWPLWGELLWIFGWSLVGGFVAWGFYRPLPMALAGVGGMLLIYSIGRVVMVTAVGWLPMVPGMAAMLLAGGVVFYLNYRLRKV